MALSVWADKTRSQFVSITRNSAHILASSVSACSYLIDMPLRGADIEKAFPRFSPTTSVLQLLLDGLHKGGNQIAQVEAQSGKSESYAGILQQSSSIAVGLQSAGVTAGDIAVLSCDKSILAYSILLGTIFTGATVIVINSLDANKIYQCIGRHPVKVVFSDPFYVNSVNESVSKMILPPSLVATIEMADPFIRSLTKSVEEFKLFKVENVSKHIPLILFTSGSTGDPKGVEINDLLLQRLGYTFDDESIESYLLMSAFSWISSPISLVSSLLKGYTLVLSNSKDPAHNLEFIQRYKVNGVTLSASVVSLFMKEPSLSQLDLSSLSMVVIGGDVVLKREAEMFIQKVLQGRTGVQSLYGMTETGVLTTWRNQNLLDLSKINSTGYLAPGVEIKIMNDEGVELPTESLGELWVKSIAMMSGYWNQPELTKQLFDNDGFFQTGDAGCFDKDGFLYIKGRVKDLIDFKGFKISVSDVEDILKSHPAVLEAAVISKPHPESSHQLSALVVKRSKCDVTSEEIVAFVGGK
ncbi:hypothetical protein J6590_015628 [Homalodisca vitripennis]|nr:hypothetical protein J6590_015628 [Homalodisca vitripennis]